MIEFLHSTEFIQAFGWLLSFVTILSFWLLGSKNILGWYTSIFNCFLWTLYSYVTGQWGLFPGTAFIFIMDIRGIYKWKNDKSNS